MDRAFSHKPKHHRGRATKSQVLVFGLVDKSTLPTIGHMDIVEHRALETFLPLIEKGVRHESIIRSDEWRTYRNTAHNPNYHHRTANHS